MAVVSAIRTEEETFIAALMKMLRGGLTCVLTIKTPSPASLG
jgi:hypothetical protein